MKSEWERGKSKQERGEGSEIRRSEGKKVEVGSQIFEGLKDGKKDRR